MSQQGPQPPQPPSSGGPPQPPSMPPGHQPPVPAQPPQVMYAYAQPMAGRGTNGFAIASLICAFLCAPLGLIFGFVARSQIKESHEGGDGLAIAGIVISLVAIGLLIVYIILVVTLFGTVVHTFNNSTINNIIQNAFQGLPSPST